MTTGTSSNNHPVCFEIVSHREKLFLQAINYETYLEGCLKYQKAGALRNEYVLDWNVGTTLPQWWWIKISRETFRFRMSMDCGPTTFFCFHEKIGPTQLFKTRMVCVMRAGGFVVCLLHEKGALYRNIHQSHIAKPAWWKSTLIFISGLFSCINNLEVGYVLCSSESVHCLANSMLDWARKQTTC